jgi:hypothetical protein
MSASTRRLNDPKHLKLCIPGNGHVQDTSRYGLHGTWSGTAAYVAGPYGRQVADLNGTDTKITAGNIGTIRTVAFLVKPDTTTEEFVLLSTGNDIMVSGGTVTYAGVTASYTYVNGVATTTMVAGVWQHVVCVLSADHAASAFAIGTDGTNFGAGDFGDVRAYNVALTGDEALSLFRMRR